MKYFFSIFLIVAFAVQAQAQSISTPVVTGSAFCAGTLISCTVNASGFQAGNKFQLELSDGNGNFNQPIVLGEATDTALTSISGTLPKSALAGIGYRVRLVATQPAQTSAANAQNLTIIAAPYLQLADTLRVCGTSATLDAGPGLAGYTWNTGATTQTVSVSSNGDYSVTVNNGFCTNADTIHVNFNNSGIVNNDTTLCQGGEMTLNSFGVGEPVQTLSGFDGPYYYNGHTYFYSQGTTTWTDAHTLCTQMGGHLATISDVSENNFLFQYTNAIRSGWIGLTDELSEGNYLWVTGEPFSFSYWDRGQPDNSGNEDYIHLTNNAGRWNDLPNNVPSLSFWLEFDQILTKKQKANWSTGDTTQNILVRPSGNTTIQLTTSNGITTCSDSVRISVQPLPAYPLVDTVSLCAGTTVLDAGNGYQNYLWSTGATTQTITVNQDGVYRSTVTAGACILTDSILVSLNNAQILTPDTTLCFGQELVIQTKNIQAKELLYENNFETDAQGWNTNTRSGFNGSTVLGPFYNGSISLTQNFGRTVDSVEIEFDFFPFDSWDYDEPFQFYINGIPFSTSFFQMNRNYSSDPRFFLISSIPGRCWAGGATFYYHRAKFILPLNSSSFNFTVSQQNAAGGICDESWGFDNFKIYGINPTKSKSALWSTGDTTASLRVQPGTTTTYVLNSSNGLTACSDSIRVSVEKPEVALALSRPTTFCSGDSLVFLATGGTRPLQFQWIRNNNPVATGTNLENFRADSSGSYSLITLSPFGCNDTSNSTALTVVQRPGALLTATSTTVNNGTPVTLVATPTYPNNVLQYVWKRGNDTLPGSNVLPNQSSIITTKAGSYVVSITNDGCTDTSNILVLTAPNGGTGSAAVVPLGPAAFHYQAALTGNGGLPLAGRAVRLKLSISDSVNAAPLFQEIQSATTDSRGMVHLSIGKGQAVVGNLDQLDWAVPTPRMLVVDLDTLANGSFVRMGASSLLSVPYAQYARTSGDGRRSVYGIIDHQAKIVQGQGFTLSNLGNGIIMIHLDEAFKELPQFWVSASEGGDIGFYQVIDRQNIQVSCSFHTGSLIQFEVKGK